MNSETRGRIDVNVIISILSSRKSLKPKLIYILIQLLNDTYFIALPEKNTGFAIFEIDDISENAGFGFFLFTL